MGEQCPLCERAREYSSEFCNLHNTALRNLEGAFASWSTAYDGKISKKEYLDKIETVPETGQAVKEVIYHFRGKGTVP